MIQRFSFLLLALLLPSGMASPLAAQNAGVERQLERALKWFPDADADRDGSLSMAEALQYIETHPELKDLLPGKKSGSKGANRSDGPPPLMTTPAAKGLPPGLSVFVCAHSFMIYTANLLPPLAESAGIGYQDAGRQMIGGSQVIQHWNLPDPKNFAKAALQEGKVDVLTLSPHMLLPDEGITNFTRLGLKTKPGLRILVQASWPGRDGQMDKNFTNEQRNDATAESLQTLCDTYHATWVKSLEDQVRSLNTEIGREAVHIVPVGDAVFALRRHILEGTAPGLTRQTDLFRDALGHPLPPLAALVTYCHFATIYGRNPAGLPVPTELQATPNADELNRLLQQLAWDAVTQYPMSGVTAAVATPES